MIIDSAPWTTNNVSKAIQIEAWQKVPQDSNCIQDYGEESEG